MVLIHHGKRHDAYAFILETLFPFSGVSRCGQLGRAALFKETRSVTMNIFSKKKLFKSFVKIELSYVFTINMFSTAENCIEK